MPNKASIINPHNPPHKTGLGDIETDWKRWQGSGTQREAGLPSSHPRAANRLARLPGVWESRDEWGGGWGCAGEGGFPPLADTPAPIRRRARSSEQWGGRVPQCPGVCWAILAVGCWGDKLLWLNLFGGTIRSGAQKKRRHPTPSSSPFRHHAYQNTCEPFIKQRNKRCATHPSNTTHPRNQQPT